MKTNKKYSRAQNAMVNLATRPSDGFEVEVIEQSVSYGGITEAVREAERKTANSGGELMARVIMAEGGSAQESVRMMARSTGTKGADMGTRLAKMIRAASGIEKRPVTLVFDEAKNMRVADVVKLIHSASHTAAHDDINLRVVFIVGRVPVYDFKQRGYFSADYPAFWSNDTQRMLFSPHARVWRYSAKSLSERKPVKPWIEDGDAVEQNETILQSKVG